MDTRQFQFLKFIFMKDYMSGTTSNAQIKWAQTKQTGGYVETKKGCRIKEWCMWAKTPFQMQ